MNKTGNTLFELIRTLFVTALRLTALLFAWCCKVVGMIFGKIGKTIERIITQ